MRRGTRLRAAVAGLEALTALALLALLPGACSGLAARSAGELAPGPIRIGLITSLTGLFASNGTNLEQGALQAVDEINASGGIDGHRLQLAVADDASRPESAAAAFADLTGQGVAGIVGPASAENALAVVPLTQPKRVPVILTAPVERVLHAGATMPGPVLPNVFAASLPAGLVAERFLQYAKGQGLSRLAVVHDSQSLFAQEGTDTMAAAAPRYGLTIATDEPYESNQLQVQTAMAHIRAGGAQGIVVWGSGSPPPLIVHAWAAAGLKIPLMFSQASASTQFVKAAGQDGEGVLVATSVSAFGPALPEGQPARREVLAMATAFQTRNGYYPPEPAFNGYAAVKLLGRAIRNAGSTQPKEVDDALSRLSLSTAGGTFRYTRTDHRGIGLDWAGLAVIRGGQLAPTDYSLKLLQPAKP